MPKIEIIDTTKDNIRNYGFCGYSNPENEGHIAKSEWLKKRYEEGLKLKVLQSESDGSVGMIEYIPGEFAWRAVEADGYMFIHCLMINKSKYKGRGYGGELLKHCISDAKKARMHGVAVMTSAGTWMAGKDLFIANGFELVESFPPRFNLLALRFNKKASLPSFSKPDENLFRKYQQGLTIFWSDQCPFIRKSVSDVCKVAEKAGIKPKLMQLKNCRSARKMPNPYGTYCMIYNGSIVADHPISAKRFSNIIKKGL